MSKLIPVPYLDQTDAAPTGCESVSAVMLLQYFDVNISVNEFIDSYLDKGDFHMADGELYGPHPADCFVGDPYSSDAMGCYAPVICAALRRVLGKDYEIRDESGREIDDIIREYIDEKNAPVMLWATINLRPAIEGPYWRLDGSGELFTWWSNEHCMLLTGYDDECYVFNDPWENNGVIRYDKGLVRQRYIEQHKQAVGVSRK